MKKKFISTVLFFCFWSFGSAQEMAGTGVFLPKSAPYNSPKNTFPAALPLALEASEYDDYGGKVGVGISIFNGLMIPFRYYANPKNVVEASLGLGGILIFTPDNEIESYQTAFLAGIGYTFFNNRFLKEKKKRNKVRANGLAVRANQLFGDFKTTSASLGWAMETFKENKKGNSFIFELGLQAGFPNFVYQGRFFDKPRAGIYLRCHWNFFLK